MEGLPGRGEVIFIRFPFSDLSGYTNRPALVLMPLDRDDMLVCEITSKAYSDARAVTLTDAFFTRGGLPMTSYARPTKLFTAHRSMVSRSSGRLNKETIAQVTESIVTALRAEA